MNTRKILFTGGGTGGHIYPIAAVARALNAITQEEQIPLTLFFAGSADFDLEVLRKEGIKVFRVPSGKLRRYAFWRAPFDIIKTGIGFLYALLLVWIIMPDVIFAKGGYGSFAVSLAGRLYFIPLLVHDSDSIPGLVSRLLGKISSRVALSFPSALPFFPPSKRAFIGNPIRKELLYANKEKAYAVFNLKGGRPLILIMGGSQGSVRLNNVLGEIMRELLRVYEVIHQCGSANKELFEKELKEIYGVDAASEPYYHLKGYLYEEEALALNACDLIISRAGANSIYEIAAVKKPSILIPLPEAASDHQRQNALFYAQVGAGVTIEEANLKPHILLNEIKDIIENKNRQDTMSKAAQQFSKPDAADKIAQALIELAS